MTRKIVAEFDENSMDYTDGVTVKIKGYITNFNADAQARLSNALVEIAKWVNEESGRFTGYIKCGIYLEDGAGVTLDLTNLENGVEIQGVLEPTEKVGFKIVFAIPKIDKHELEHEIMHALEDSFLDIELTEGGHSHSHDNDCCGCGGHHHKHHHHHH